ncbi:MULTISPECIES: monooxygenase [unclassified Aureimonas]|uniref:monooxygenase n=1 Tax=unclassified Aureimonas TaxID=2615206 RepID=UPI0006F75F18|nr:MULTISPECIES: monooxygenase [unclassified Aureimonas]KQT61740.1 monooxygenase [Aureimonas sp. Leaf460]KQT65697.1 monooxygenase [Aureimonas sp. Leaf427]
MTIAGPIIATRPKTQVDRAWGSGPSARYEEIAARFRPLFARIQEGVIDREVHRRLPHEEIGWLKQAGFGALRVPQALGGLGVTLPELFNLLIELAEADSNLVQALRAHFGFTEDVLNTKIPGRRELWASRIAAGETVGSAWTELDSTLVAFSTTVTPNDGGWRLTGSKFYTTGSLFADWVQVGCVDAAGEPVSAIVSRHAPGVEVVDDWDGMGQRLTASGTTRFAEAPVASADVYPEEDGFTYSAAFYQLVQLATIAGIGRAAANDVAAAVAKRQRTYTHAAATRSSQDPQVLQVVGRIRAAAYASGAIVLRAAEALQRVHDARLADDAEAEEQANAIAELEAAQAQTVVTDLILNATTILFDALGASATLRTVGLDRHWRNARTLSSHNPRIYKDRIVGDFAVNGTLPPYQWRVGTN